MPTHNTPDPDQRDQNRTTDTDHHTYDDAYGAGWDDCHRHLHDNPGDDGYDHGYHHGYEHGYDDGWANGHRQGWLESHQAHETRHHQGDAPGPSGPPPKVTTPEATR